MKKLTFFDRLSSYPHPRDVFFKSPFDHSMLPLLVKGLHHRLLLPKRSIGCTSARAGAPSPPWILRGRQTSCTRPGRTRSPRRMGCRLSSSGLMNLRSRMRMTRAEPMAAPSGMSSIPMPLRTKCAGASMWVPVCAPISRRDTVQGSPRSISRA